MSDPRWTPLTPGLPPNASHAGRRHPCPHCGRSCAITASGYLWVHDALFDGLRRLCPGASIPVDVDEHAERL